MGIQKKIISDSLFTIIRVSIATVRGLILIPIITNILGAGSYGIWATLLAIVSLIRSTGSLHLHGALIRYGAEDSSKESTYSDILAFIVVFSLIISTIIAICGYYVDISFLFGDELINDTLLVFSASILIFSTMVWKMNLNFPRSKGHVKTYDTLRILKDTTETIGLVAIFMSGFGIIVATIYLSSVAVTLSLIIFLHSIYKYSIPLPSISRYRKYFSYSLPMIPRIVSGKLLENGDKYLILYFLSPTSVGIYSVAYAISSLLGRFTSILNPTLYPTISKAWDDEKQAEISKLYNNIYRVYFILAIPSVFGLVILSEQLLVLFSNREVANQGMLLMPLLVVAFALKGAHNPLTYILAASEDTKEIAVSIVFGTTINLILNIFFIPIYGVFGAGVSTVISACVIYATLYYYTTGKIDIYLPEYTLLRSITSSIIMSVSLYILPNSSPLVDVIIYPLVGSSIYAFLIIGIGEFSEDEINWVRNYIHNQL